MNISKALLICGAAFLASCGDYGLPYGNGDTKDVSEVDVPKENPADDLQLMFLGASLNNDKATNLVDLIASGKDFSFNGVDYKDVNTGFGSTIVRSLNEGGIDGKISAARFAKQSGDDRCKVAKEEKILWHENQGTGIPSAFGKFTDMKLKRVKTKGLEQWIGYVELCTWIENGDTLDEYFWHIDLVDDGPTNTTRTYTNPFNGTLDTSNLINTAGFQNAINTWRYKVHGKKNAVVISTVWRNGSLVDQTAEPNVYTNDENCFDLFLNSDQIGKLRSTGSLDFDDQAGYCMGRCDGLILNTH